MQKKLVAHERDGEKTVFDGRTVFWIQTPETTGGKYSSVCTCVYDPGARAYPAHSHPDGEETVYVISGAGKVKIGEEIFSIEPGSVFLFPQGVPHMGWNSGGEPMHIVCFYAPVEKATGYAFHEEFDFPEFQNQKRRVE